MLRRRTAAAADDVDKAGGGELIQDGRSFLRRFVVLTEGIWQSCVRIGAHIGVGHTRKLVHVGAQLSCAERTVKTDGERLRVPDRIPERFGRLPGERTSGSIGD